MQPEVKAKARPFRGQGRRCSFSRSTTVVEDPAAAFDAHQQVREGELRLHRLLDGRAGARRRAVFGTPRMLDENSRRKLRQRQALPRRSTSGPGRVALET